MNQADTIQASFLLSAPSLDHCPDDLIPEVAFVGRSNSGKSSTLNRLTGSQKLARVSKTPGRTQMINFFDAVGGGRLVDLPGYGYAKVKRTVRESWSVVAAEYLEFRSNLVGVVVVVDSRHSLKPMDVEMIQWGISRGVRLLVLLNKADKLKYNARMKVQRQIRDELKSHSRVSTLLFSALSDMGASEARDWVRTLLVKGFDQDD